MRVNAPTREIGDLLSRTDKANPRPADVEQLQRALREVPDLWRCIADMTKHTQRQTIQALSGESTLMQKSLEQGVVSMRADLGHATAPPLERLLIEQVVLCWLDYHEAKWRHHVVLSDGTSFENAGWLEKRLNGAYRRYVRSIEALARIRKMGPKVQINIAEQQVNVSG